MITLRQIERTWTANKYQQLIGDLLVARSENSPRLRSVLSGSLAAAALGLIRLDELNQAHAPLAGKFLRRILVSQNSDGGWDDPILSALCLRALHTSRGQGESINRGIAHLADLQKTDGAWPATPIRRLEADGFTTAFILFSLGNNESFRSAIRLGDALGWCSLNHSSFDHSSQRLWEVVSRKLGSTVARAQKLASSADASQMLICSSVN